MHLFITLHIIASVACCALLATSPAIAAEPKKTESAKVIASSKTPAKTNKQSKLTLDDAIASALAHSPRLEGFESAIRAAQGAQRQAGAFQNPEVSISKENIKGNSAYRIISPPQNSIGLSQTLDIGGKISAREDVASKDVDIATLEHQAAKLDLIRDVTIAYAEVIAAEENVRLAVEQKALSEDVLKAVSKRVHAAAAPLIQQSRAEVERSAALIALNQAKREKEITRKQLAALMGERNLAATLDATAFYAIVKPKDALLDEKAKNNPDLLKLERSLQQSKARLDLEKANAIPNPTLNAGIIRLPSANAQALVVGISLPIPVLNANRGNIARARHDITRTELENRQSTLNLFTDLTQAREWMNNAYFQAKTLKTEVLPSAEKAFALAREGYDLGRFPYLEVLDAQRSLFAIRQQQVAATKDFHSARSQVERLTAEHAAHSQTKDGEL